MLWLICYGINSGHAFDLSEVILTNRPPTIGVSKAIEVVKQINWYVVEIRAESKVVSKHK